MKIEYVSMERLEMRQNHGLVALLLIVGVVLPCLLGVAMAEKTPSPGLLLVVIGMPFVIIGPVAMWILGSSRHTTFDRKSGLVTLVSGALFRKRVRVIPLSAVTGARIEVVRNHKNRHDPGLRPLLLIREGETTVEIPLVSMTTNWKSNRAAVDAINTWLNEGTAVAYGP